MRRSAEKAFAVAGALLGLLLLSTVAPVPVRAAGGVALDASIDGRPVDASTEARPIRLSPRSDATMAVEVTNNSSEPLDIRTVRLEGKVLGLTFFAYDTAVGLKVAPGSSGSRRFRLDLGGLDGQATGLIPGAVKLLDVDRNVVADERGVLDVRGSLRSVYGAFGLGVAFLTVLSFLGCLVGLARHRLPPNRWRRALRFLTAGLGFGLLVNFTLSATRVFVPTADRWLTIMVVSGALLFGLGYLTPAPDTDEDEDEPDEDELAALPPAPVEPVLAAPPPQRELAEPDELLALPADVGPGLDPPGRSELATPDGLKAVPADLPAPAQPPPAPPTVVVPPVPEER